MTSIDVLTPAGATTGSVELPAEVFDVQVNVPLIHQVVVAQLAAALGVVRALTGGSELRDDDLVDQRHVDLDAEDLGGQVEGAGGRAGRGLDLDRGDLGGLELRHGVRPPSPRCGRARAHPWGRGRHP